MALRIFIPIIYIICILFHFFIPVYIRTLLFLYFWDCRCFCSNCSVDFTTKPEECQCCREIYRCGEVMERFGDTSQCITLHPGFHNVCLNQHVLEVAALGLKTKSGKSYRVLYGQGPNKGVKTLYSINCGLCRLQFLRGLYSFTLSPFMASSWFTVF